MAFYIPFLAYIEQAQAYGAGTILNSFIFLGALLQPSVGRVYILVKRGGMTSCTSLLAEADSHLGSSIHAAFGFTNRPQMRGIIMCASAST